MPPDDVPDWIDPEDAWVYRVGVARFVEEARMFERLRRTDPQEGMRVYWKERADVMWINAVAAMLEGKLP